VIVFLALVLVVLAGLVVALVLGRWGGRGEAMVAPTSTSPFEPLPGGRLDADRAGEVRFDIGLRGYRMDQVDTVLDRLVLELRSRDEELGTLRSGALRSDRADRADRTHQGVRTHPAGGADPADTANAAGHADPAVER
jgi:DivIVA domain-containing protein